MNSTWLILAVILGALAVFFLVYSARKRNAPDAAPQPRQDPLKFSDDYRSFGPGVIGPGAIVSHGGVDYVCRGAIELRQGQYVWHEYLLDGGKGGEYLSVEYDEGQLNLGWWISRPDLGVEPATELTVEGTRYRKTESGAGTYRSEGTTGVGESGSYTYWDMAETGGNRLLGFERYGDDGSWESSLGWKVLPGELQVYPAPEQ
ncbi:DUF4178 domain-containing protein [Corynebacterium pacaense]|uniref:DUF4178 domain-containing protein n=1 Tax=Corynebacterium pacaense TaxID=1816684 RepID=UPI0009BAF529